MPKLAGHDVAAATATLTRGGISAANITQSQVNSATVPLGKIVSTKPAAGAKINSSSTVVLLVSKGKLIPPVNVPSVTNLSVQSAELALKAKNLNFTVQNVTSSCSALRAPNVVLCTSPVAGTSVKQQSLSRPLRLASKWSILRSQGVGRHDYPSEQFAGFVPADGEWHSNDALFEHRGPRVWWWAPTPPQAHRSRRVRPSS